MIKKNRYLLYQFKISDFDQNNKLKQLTNEELLNRQINLSENQLVEVIQNYMKRPYKQNQENFIPEIVFLDIEGSNNSDKLKSILNDGITVNERLYILFGKSSSQSRNGIIVFILNDMANEINRTVTLGKTPKEDQVISKYESYKGLCLSSCKFINVVPRIAIVGNPKKLILEKIKYLDENDQPQVGEQSVEVELWDGMGIHTKEFGQRVAKALKIEYTPAAMQIRLLPYTKGLSVEMDFKEYFRKQGIKEIIDIKGKPHDVNSLDMIFTTSMAKGWQWFDSVEEYMSLREKYFNPIGIVKFSEPTGQADKYTKVSYQYLQTLNLSDGQIISLAEYQKDLIERIYQGNLLATQIFLGLLAKTEQDEEEVDNDEIQTSGKILEAIKINPVLLKDPYIKKFLGRQLEKSINQMCMGKIYVEGRYSFIAQDPYALLQWIAYKDLSKVTGCLNKNEQHSPGVKAEYAGFRSPLIHPSEAQRFNFVTNDLADKWLGHLDNIIVFNVHDIMAQAMGGADFDGDQVLWTNNPTILKGIIETEPVIDIDDKAVAKQQSLTKENIINCHLRTLSSDIGKITNIATKYISWGSSKGNILEYDDQLVTLRVAQGREIDYAKTLVKMTLPGNLEKAVKKEKPYFLRYKYPEKYKEYPDKFQRNNCAMNMLCLNIENWHKQKFIWDRWKNSTSDTSELFINKDLIKVNPEATKRITNELRTIYKYYNSGMNRIRKLPENEKDEKYDILFESCRQKVDAISGHKELIASICVQIVYIESKTKSYAFPWLTCWQGILTTLSRNSADTKLLPIRITDAKDASEIIDTTEYLGNQYGLKGVPNRTLKNVNEIIQSLENKQNKKKSINLETTLMGFAYGINDIKRIKDQELTINPKQYKDRQYIGLWLEDEYICSLPAKADFRLENLIDLSEYFGQNCRIEPIEQPKGKSIKVKMIIPA